MTIHELVKTFHITCEEIESDYESREYFGGTTPKSAKQALHNELTGAYRVTSRTLLTLYKSDTSANSYEDLVKATEAVSDFWLSR